MHSNKYTTLFVAILTAVVALVLSLLATGLKEKHDLNESIFNKRAVLSAIEDYIGDNVKADKIPESQVLDIFDNQIEQRVINMEGELVDEAKVMERGYKGGKAEHVEMAKEKKKPEPDRILPLYVYSKENGDKVYIMSVRGNGLWDEIWGNIAIESDFTTIAGAAFDHKGETPGLGAEIKDNPSFRAQFKGKKITDESGIYTSVYVRKGGAQNDRIEVDGISGSTVTADGVTEMLYRGIKYYDAYFEKLKQG